MVWNVFRREPKDAGELEAKASATGPVVAWQNMERVAWSARDTVSLTRTGFSGNPVELLARAFGPEGAA